MEVVVRSLKKDYNSKVLNYTYHITSVFLQPLKLSNMER